MHYKINSVDTSTSPDGIYELSFQQIGDPDWPFDYTYSRLVLKNGKETDASLILDFYLIDCGTLTVTDEQTNHWH